MACAIGQQRHVNPSRIQIGNLLALQFRDHVLEQQFALLQAFELQLVVLRIRAKTHDRIVQIAMFDTQFNQLSGDGGGIFVHGMTRRRTHLRV